MITRAIGFAVRRPWVALFAWLCIAAAAAIYASGVRLEMFPRLQPAAATIQTEAPGLAADQVERLVTRPLEAVLLGETGVSSERSQSIQGLSVITVELLPGIDPRQVQQRLAGRITEAAPALPPGVDPPRLEPLTSPDGAILKVGFTSARLDAMQLRSLVQFVVRPRLLATPGVARVSVYGGQVARIEVRARPGDLSDSDLGLLDVVRSVQKATSVAGAGFIDTPAQRVLIEPRGQALSASQVAAGQIQSAGAAPVRIGDVAEVVEAPAPAVGDALVMGRPGVVLTVEAQYGADAVAEARTVDAALDDLRPALRRQGVEVTPNLVRPADVIVSAVRAVLVDLAIGAALALLLLLVALRDLRAALISFIAIPLALLLAVAGMRALGLGLNTMTLGGLVLGLGVVIDDGLIDIENLLSRLRDAEARHASHAEAVMRASPETRVPVLVGTLVMVLALAPLLALPGPIGELLRPLAAAAMLAMAASVLLALALTPALALLFLPHVGPEPHPPLVSRLRAAHGRWVERRSDAPGLALWTTLGAVIVAALAIGLLGKAGLPPLHSGRVVVDLTAPGSISPEAMRDFGRRISAEVLKLPGVRTVSEQIGRDPTDARAWGVDRGEIDVGLGPDPPIAAQDEAERRIRTVLAGYPGLQARVSSSFGQDGGSAGPEGRFAVTVFGQDSSALAATARQVAAVLRRTPGARDVRGPAEATAPAMRVDLDFAKLAIFGLSAADVMQTVQVAFQGQRAARIYHAGRTEDLAVVGGSDVNRDPEAMGSLLLRSPSGFSTPLDKVANVYLTEAPASILHQGGLPMALVSADPAPARAADFAARARAAIARQVRPPDGVFIGFPAPADGAAAARRALALGAVLAIAAILVLLLVAFRSHRSAMLILSAGPPALVGGVVAALIGSSALGFGAAVGLVAVFGLSVRNAILMLARLEELLRGAEWSLGVVVEAAQDRLIPILAAALCIALGLLPLILADRQSGAEVLRPMAGVILGGLITGSAFSVLALPVLVRLFWRPAPATPPAA